MVGALVPGRGLIPAALRRLMQELENLIWPVQCAGCGQWDTVLCESCAKLATAPARVQILEDAAGVPTWTLLSLGSYQDELREVILSAKHDPVRDLSEFMFRAGFTLGVRAWEEIQGLLDLSGMSQSTVCPRGIWVVPAPSSHSRRRRREEIVPGIASGVAQGLLRSGTVPNVLVVPAVKLVRHAKGQSGKDAAVRRQGRVHAFQVTRPAPPGVLMVVVDDVSASGATLAEMFHVLGSGAQFAVVLAAGHVSGK